MPAVASLRWLATGCTGYWLRCLAGGDAWSSARLCAVCPGIVGVNGAGVMLMSSDIPRGSLNSTDDVSELIEELQYTLGEGPCADACQQDLVVDRLLAYVADDVDARRLRLE